MKKRVLMVLVFAALLFTLNPTAATASGDYKNASEWAVPELDKASGFGLVTDKIKNNMKANITREEFAEIAVRLYETYTGEEAQTGSESFSDTKNPEILKAANLKITGGIGGGRFGPDQLVTREQIATFLFRTIKAMDPEGDFSASSGTKFSDDALIDSWAQEGVYFCAEAGIIKGIQNKDDTFRFDADGNSSREVAVIVCTRAYEWFISSGNGQPSDNPDVETDGQDWNGGLIILSSEFRNGEYQVREVDGESFIFLPFEEFKYVFKMPGSSYKYPEVTLQDGQISVGWKNSEGEIMLQALMQVNSPEAYLNGEAVDITVGPFKQDDTVYVPVNLFISMFEMQDTLFQGRLCFQYTDTAMQQVLEGSWSSSDINLFMGYKDMVTGLVSLPSVDWNYTFNLDGTYRMAAASCGGMDDGIILQSGKYKLLGNTIIYYDQVETLYKGRPLMLKYEKKNMGDRLEFTFIDNYDEEQDKIELDLIWYHRVKE
ncbi:MAG: S-layer homology domain-containing protein [Thermoclostridium sp.]|nr:S-layer homology domain-containing protein [Thermoclostridium sp.]